MDFGSNRMVKVMWNCMCALFWVNWMERNARIFEDKELEVADIYEKAEFSFSLWASTDKAFKNFPFSLFVHNQKDVMGP